MFVAILLLVAPQEFAAVSSNPKCSKKDLDKLLEKFETQKGESSLITQHSKTDRITEDNSTKLSKNYLGVCKYFGLNHAEVEINEKEIDKLVSVGWLFKKKMKKAEAA